MTIWLLAWDRFFLFYMLLSSVEISVRFFSFTIIPYYPRLLSLNGFRSSSFLEVIALTYLLEKFSLTYPILSLLQLSSHSDFSFASFLFSSFVSLFPLFVLCFALGVCDSVCYRGISINLVGMSERCDCWKEGKRNSALCWTVGQRF